MTSNIVNKFRVEMNEMASRSEPFIFIIDFEMEKPLIYPLDNIPDNILFSIPGLSNARGNQSEKKIFEINRRPVNFSIYSKAFKDVISNIAHGNSYLLNLTFPSEIDIDLTLHEIFLRSEARYKLLVDNRFVVFSPETFVTISKDLIKSFPMKGTIDASEPNALDTIMNDEKEISEHNTIVDLIRNDLSIVANDVSVTRYRYNELIRTDSKELIQISSEISGMLNKDWQNKVGDIIVSLLPAGSISGAPKKETLRIIKECEIDSRGYYTGVFGVFDGKELDSAVMIRYIEQIGEKYVYRSGGGITYLSDLKKEYMELISKVYVPFS